MNALRQKRIGRALWIFALTPLLVAGFAAARGSWLGTFKSQYGIADGSLLDTCNTCHVAGQDFSVQNSYGLDIKANDPDADLIAALIAVEQLDSDNDGLSNIDEINGGSFPGDPLSTPVEEATWGSIKAQYE